MELLEQLRALTRGPVTPILSAPGDIQRCIAEVYGFRMSIDAAHDKLGRGTPDIKNLEQFVNLSRLDALEATSEPVIAASEFLLLYAYEQRASDIHIEPRRTESTIRMRIDGVLHAVYRIPKAVHAALTNRFKVMARLDISGRRPQDGRIRTARGEGEMDLRVSTVPTAFGDKVVIRILNPTVMVKDLAESRLPPRRAGGARALAAPAPRAHRRHGPDRERQDHDPLLRAPGPRLAGDERGHDRGPDSRWSTRASTRIQADANTGTSFVEALRHVLRQDPDVIMVGEIRDGETAVQAVQAALTGHLVLTTIHTNDSVGVIARMIDLGVPPFLVGATLVGALSQRLVRNVCPACARDVVLTADEVALLRVTHPEEHAGKLLARRGEGCAKCRYTGYYGRAGIFEVLGINARLRKLISEGAAPEVLSRTARQDGLRALREHAIAKVAAGVTSLEEAIRVTADAER